MDPQTLRNSEPLGVSCWAGEEEEEEEERWRVIIGGGAVVEQEASLRRLHDGYLWFVGSLFDLVRCQ